jgi:hypothetical protein
VTAMDVTISWSTLPPDDPDAAGTVVRIQELR